MQNDNLEQQWQKNKTDMSSNVGFSMLIEAYKTGSPQHENRKERIPETGGGQSRVTLEMTGRQADWQDDIHRGPDKGLKQKHTAQQRGREPHWLL